MSVHQWEMPCNLSMEVNNNSYHHHHFIRADNNNNNAHRHELVLPLLTKPQAATRASFSSSSSSSSNTADVVEAGKDAKPVAGNTATTTTTPMTTGKLRKSRSKSSINRTNNASAGRPSLFWVHSDPQSLAEGTKEDTLKRIRSHVMAEHNRKKRLENTRRHKSKNWKHLAFQPVESTVAVDVKVEPTSQKPPPVGSCSLGVLDLSSPPFSSSSSSSSSSTAKHEDIGANGEIVNDDELVGNGTSVSSAISASSVASRGSFSVGVSSPGDRRLSVTVTSPWSPIGQSGLDPFNILHTPLSDRMLRHLQYCMSLPILKREKLVYQKKSSVYDPEIIFGDQILYDLTRRACPLQSQYASILQAHWVSLVQQGPAPLHACICVAASDAALSSGEFPLADPSQRCSSALVLDTYHHRGETIRLVNEGLSDPVKAASDELIAAVSTLLTIEIASGNVDYLKIHLAGLRQMVTLRNNFADVPPLIRYQVSWNDVRIAGMSLTKPIFPFVRYARPSAKSIIPPNKDLSILASRLMSFAKIPGFFGDAMQRTMYDLLELTWYAESVKGENLMYQEFNEELETYFSNEVLYIEYSLNADRYAATGEAKGDATMEGCVRLTCLLFHNSAIWQFYPAMAIVFPKPIRILRMALEATIVAGCYSLCRDLLIWILFIGACACGSHLPGEREFFVSQLASAVRLQDIQSWQELRALLMGFFYVDRYYSVALRVLWDEIRMVPVQH